MDAQGLHFIGLERVVLAKRYRVRLVFLLRSLLLCLCYCDILGKLFNPRKNVRFWLTAWVQLRLCCSERYLIGLIRCKQMCNDLLEDGVEVEKMWIPAHVVFEGNEIVDARAWHAALIGAVFERPLSPVDFQGLARSVLRDWLGKWDTADTVRYAHSILPKVSHRPWFEGQREDRKFVSSV
jgi:hypothetical protein